MAYHMEAKPLTSYGRFAHYAQRQREIWAKVYELQAKHDLGEAIDILWEAVKLYEAELKKSKDVS